jgi:membrane associated rhomboid family serine protease
MWFRLGQVEVTTTVLVTGIAAISIVFNALLPSLLLRLYFAPGVISEPWRVFTWPLANPIGFWPVIGLFFFWYFGSRLEEILGRGRMLRFLIYAWLVHTFFAVIVGMAGTGEPVLAGISVLYYTVILAFVLQHPDLRFGIPFTQISFPAWAAVVVVIAISALQMIAARAVMTILFMAVSWASMAIVGRSMGLFTQVTWLPNFAIRRRPRTPRAPRATKQSRRERKQSAQVISGPWEQEIKQHQADRIRLDELLDKISGGGMDSLSEKEKKELKSLSERLRRNG